MTDEESFAKVKFWVGELTENEPECALYVVGTKGSSGSMIHYRFVSFLWLVRFVSIIRTKRDYIFQTIQKPINWRREASGASRRSRRATTRRSTARDTTKRRPRPARASPSYSRTLRRISPHSAPAPRPPKRTPQRTTHHNPTATTTIVNKTMFSACLC